MMGNVYKKVKGNTVQRKTSLCPPLPTTAAPQKTKPVPCSPHSTASPQASPSLATGFKSHPGASARLPCQVTYLTCHIIILLTVTLFVTLKNKRCLRRKIFATIRNVTHAKATVKPRYMAAC